MICDHAVAHLQQYGWSCVYACISGRSSPLSLKTIFEQVTRGATNSLEECLDDEFAVNMNLFAMDDFESAMQAHEYPEVRRAVFIAPLDVVLSFCFV